jgi:hypothetical protein
MDNVADFNFYRAKLPDLIDFSHNKSLPNIVDFTNADFDSIKSEKKLCGDTRHYINIYNSDISKIKLDYLNFRLCFYDPRQIEESFTAILEKIKKMENSFSKKAKYTAVEDSAIRLLEEMPAYKTYIQTIFPGADLKDPVVVNFTRFYLAIGSFPSMLSSDKTEALYSGLLKNFETHGQKISYESADIERNNFIHTNWNISRIWNEYGYHKEWIFYWTASFLLIFTMTTYMLGNVLFENDNKNDVIYGMKNMPELDMDCKFPKLKKIKYAFIYTAIIFFSFSVRTENLNFRKKACVYIVIVNVVGLLCLGYLANFILQK